MGVGVEEPEEVGEPVGVPVSQFSAIFIDSTTGVLGLVIKGLFTLEDSGGYRSIYI